MERFVLFLIIAFALLACLFFGFFATVTPPIFSFILILGFFVCFISFFRPDIGIYILIISLFFAPDIRTGESAAAMGVGAMVARPLKFRPEDFLIIFITIGWFFKLAMRREPLVIRTPISAPIMIFFFAMVISTALGIVQNYVSVRRGLLFLMKKVEYFLIFFMVVNNIQTREGFRFGLLLLFLSSALVAMVGIVQYKMVGWSYFSVTSTFGPGQANVLGGFLLIVMPMIWAFFIITKEKIPRMILLGLSALTLISFLLTRSRGAYVGLVVAIAAFIYYSRKHWLLPVFVILLFAVILLAPGPIRQQVDSIFRGTIPRDFSAVVAMSAQSPAERGRQWGTMIRRTGMDISWAARVSAFMSIIPRIKKNIIFGEGLGAFELGYIDNEYVYDLISLGIVGCMAFAWLLYRIAKMVNTFLNRAAEKSVLYALSLGFLASLAGLLVQGMTITNFYTIRTMTPFWLLLGLIVVEAQLTLEEGKEPTGGTL